MSSFGLSSGRTVALKLRKRVTAPIASVRLNMELLSSEHA